MNVEVKIDSSCFVIQQTHTHTQTYVYMCKLTSLLEEYDYLHRIKLSYEKCVMKMQNQVRIE